MELIFAVELRSSIIETTEFQTVQTKDERVSRNTPNVLLPGLENQRKACAQLRTKAL